MKAKYLLIGAFMLLLVVLLAACSPAPAPAPTAVPATPCPVAPACPECPACPAPPEPVVADVPFEEEWANSPHNDAEAEAFTHWNEEDPG